MSKLILVLLAVVCAASTVPAQPQPEKPVTKVPLIERLRKLAAERTIVIAHRGDSGDYPENTLPSFEAAIKADADFVELDFHTTQDGELVCIHDATLDRTTDVVAKQKKEKQAVADFTLKDVQKLDAGAWKDAKFAGTRIPTLEKALRAIQKHKPTMIEQKAGSPRACVELLRELAIVDDVLVQSFDWQWLQQVHELEPRLMLAALGGTKKKPAITPEILAEIARTGAAMVHWDWKKLDAAAVKALRDAGYMVCVYTVDEPADYDAMIGIGVDAITTNRPARLHAHIAPAKAKAEKRSGATTR